MNKDIFISYQNEDQAFAESLCVELERRGLLCWIAPRDVIDKKMDWRASIVEAVESTRFMALVFSSNTLNSDPVKNELAIVEECKGTIVPVFLENIKPQGAFQYHLANKHRIQVSGRNTAAVIKAADAILHYYDKLFPDERNIRKISLPPLQNSSLFIRCMQKINAKDVLLGLGIIALLALAALGFKSSFFKETSTEVVTPSSARSPAMATMPLPTNPTTPTPVLPKDPTSTPSAQVTAVSVSQESATGLEANATPVSPVQTSVVNSIQPLAGVPPSPVSSEVVTSAQAALEQEPSAVALPSPKPAPAVAAPPAPAASAAPVSAPHAPAPTTIQAREAAVLPSVNVTPEAAVASQNASTETASASPPQQQPTSSKKSINNLFRAPK